MGICFVAPSERMFYKCNTAKFLLEQFLLPAFPKFDSNMQNNSIVYVGNGILYRSTAFSSYDSYNDLTALFHRHS